MPECGSQCWLCDLPVRFDTYKGCSHGCKYCFVQRNGKYDISQIKTYECEKALKDWIAGKRTQKTNWCDWDIPLHWGGVSDPFQPCEKVKRMSYNALKIFAQTKYPFVVSTKGKLISEPEYIDLLKECNCVVQISVVCSKYDVLEQGAPTFAERLEIIRKVSPNVKRVIVRIQPYMCEVFKDVYDNLAAFREAGAYGVIVEGMKFDKKKPGLVKVGADWTYPLSRINSDIKRLKERAHSLGLAFYSGENRTRHLGDNLCCCGIDGLDGFTPNTYNLNHIVRGEKIKPTEKMQEVGTALAFLPTDQRPAYYRKIKNESFADEMISFANNRTELVCDVFDLKRGINYGKNRATSKGDRSKTI